MRLALALVAMVLATQAHAIDKPARHMADDDFFLDRKILIGKRVEVPTRLKIAGDILFMSPKDNSNATFVNMDNIPRDIRKDVHSRCQESCSATVAGVVSVISSPFGNDVGIVADTLTIDP